MGNVLIVAFDGMDHELIDEFGLTHVKQKEFGRIDNHTGITEVKTGELFASFITGELSEVHGVTGVKGWNSGFMDYVERLVPKREPFYSWAASVKNVIKCVGGFDRETFTKENLQCDTVFGTVPGSRSLNVPAYDVNASIEVWSWVLDRYGIEHAAREAEKEFRQRQHEFWSVLDAGPYPLFMAHFHFLDSMNHLFGDEVEDEARLRDAYERVDAFAGDILEQAEGYDTIIFMSDHGLPTPAAHNEQAFYSSNHELFPEETPHITTFRGVIEDAVGVEREEAADEIDI